MSDNTDTANDYALAKMLNKRVIRIFSLLANHRDIPDTTDVNRSYVLLADELKQIYARQPKLQEIGQPICWQVMGNLELFHENIGEYKTLAWEYTNSGADYGEEHNASVTTLCIKTNASKPVISPQIERLLTEAESNIKAFQYELDKMYATVSFQSMVMPVVTIGSTKYHLPSMREGLAYNVISFCLSKHPNQEIGIDKLKEEMKHAGIKIFGLSNFNNDTYKSIFGKNNPLSPFMTSSPKSIQVRKTTALTDQQIAEIAEASTKISE